MNGSPCTAPNTPWFAYQWPGVVVWASGGACMLLLDGRLALSSMAMLLVLTAAIAALWLRLVWNLAGCLLAMLAFNWMFVSPRAALAVDMQQDAVLLLVMFAVSLLVVSIMTALRTHAWQLQQQAQVIAKQHGFADVLRDSALVLDCLPQLQHLLAEKVGKSSVMALKEGLPTEDDMTQVVMVGDVDAGQLHGLWHCLRSGHTLGPGTGRYQTLPDLYVPLRGRTMHYGAALLHAGEDLTPAVVAETQALCDLMGAALERLHVHNQQQRADQNAQEQVMRATLLTAIAHDYRTPLATIMGAASALEEQDTRLVQAQRQHLAHRIVVESARLKQLTGNILQLARLDTPGLQLQCDWQTAEELAGSAVQRCPQPERLQLALESTLPLLWCDPLLISQLLDNLIDNACKYSAPDSPVRLSVCHSGNAVAFAVSDSGPGIPRELQQLIFQPFQQGQALALGVDAAKRVGVGLGLALCRGIAEVHGGVLQLHATANGSCFEFLLPLRPQPSQEIPEAPEKEF